MSPAPLPSLDDVRAGLEALKTQRAREAESVAELARVAYDTDRWQGHDERARVLRGNGVLWLVVGATFGILDQLGIYSAAGGSFALVSLLTLGVVAAASLLAPRLRETPAARSALITMVVAPATAAAGCLVGWWLGLSAPVVLAFNLTILAGILADRSAEDHRMWSGAAVAAATVLVVLIWPQHSYWSAGAGIFLTSWAVARAALLMPSPRVHVRRRPERRFVIPFSGARARRTHAACLLRSSPC